MQIAFRVDASAQIGTGHFIRCLTLADALRKRDVQTFFLCRHVPEHLQTLLLKRGHSLRLLEKYQMTPERDLPHSSWLGVPQEVDIQSCKELLAGTNVDWCVVDHYGIDERWESAARTFSRRILVIDDLADRKHDCEILLDQNFSKETPNRYSALVSTKCRRLLGTDFALLRHEFTVARSGAAVRGDKIERVLVFFGGVDRDNHTVAAVNALAQVNSRDYQVDVVIGASHPAKETIVSKCHAVGFNCHIETDRMAELMSCADVAIGAGGTAVLERCCVGLPTLAIPTALNQRQQLADAANRLLVYSPEIQGSLSEGLSRHFHALCENPKLRRIISQAGLDAVDGNGTSRVVECLVSADFKLSPACEGDSSRIYEWRNHPSVRMASIDTSVIPQKDHDAWFPRVIAGTNSHLLIGSKNGSPLGVVRFDLRGNVAEVSIYRVPDSQEKGLAGELLAEAEQWLREARPEVSTVMAKVRSDNLRSMKLFLRSGYTRESCVFRKTIE